MKTHHTFTVRGGEPIADILAGAADAVGAARVRRRYLPETPPGESTECHDPERLDALIAEHNRRTESIGVGWARAEALRKRVGWRIAKRAVVRADRLIRRRDKRERTEVHFMNGNDAAARDRHGKSGRLTMFAPAVGS